MSMTGKHKSEAMIPRDAVPRWLRDLADAMEAGELRSETGAVSLEGWRGLKVSMKEGFGDRMDVKVSVKFPKASRQLLAGQPLPGGEDPDDDDDDCDSLPKYSSLKKHMKQTFKAIGQALAAGQAPPEAEARSFLADSRLMVSYPGKGEEFYAAYMEQVLAFEAALTAKDTQRMKTSYQELARLKRECHSRYA